ncbi:hypothetical protein O181_018584 [Austropuccinia psidii MF-1]|uniref:Uncharacterized protein n=1 Tax=Austropuccinia psidii MF-1 TaxID=1389203 RepID=A0A9Q3GTW9_9BASI|nr:hypothetical protein [Austropuccinia psidii MF-1]
MPETQQMSGRWCLRGKSSSSFTGRAELCDIIFRGQVLKISVAKVEPGFHMLTADANNLVDSIRPSKVDAGLQATLYIVQQVNLIQSNETIVDMGPHSDNRATTSECVKGLVDLGGGEVHGGEKIQEEFPPTLACLLHPIEGLVEVQDLPS